MAKKSAHRENRTLHRLSAMFVRTVSKKGTYGDGGNLYLQVGIGGGAKSWIFIYTRARLSGDDSHERFIKALEHEYRITPPRRHRHRGDLLKIANVIVNTHERDYAAHEAAYKSGERKKSELVEAAERYVKDRRPSYVGLGPANTVSLAEARERAAKYRAMLAEKPPRDPLAVLNQQRRAQANLNAKTKTFLEMGESYIISRETDPDHPIRPRTKQGFDERLHKHLRPLHNMYPADITAEHVFNIIQPLRMKGRRTSLHRDRKLIEWIIEWARAHEAFPENRINPASMQAGSRLRIMMRTTSTDPKKWAKHHPALHFSKMPKLFAKLQNIEHRTDFMVAEAARAVNKTPNTIYNYIRLGRLLAYKPDKPFSSRSMYYWLIKPEELFKVPDWSKARDVIPGLPSVALYALFFQILTAARPNEVLGMRWSEWEEDIKVWHLPWQRAKQGGITRQDHYVPLSPEATAILEMLREQQRRDEWYEDRTGFVFGSYWTTTLTSASIGIPPCPSTIRNLLEKNVDAADADKTLHGMRTAFSSWATRLGYNEDDIERGLSHIKGYGSTDVARLYSRDAFNDDGADANVISLFNEDPLRGLFEAWAIFCTTGKLPKRRAVRKPAEDAEDAEVKSPQRHSMK